MGKTISTFLTQQNMIQIMKEKIMKELKSELGVPHNISLVSKFQSNFDRETGCAFKTCSQNAGTYKLS